MSTVDAGPDATGRPAIRVLLVDDDALVRGSLRLMLGGRPEIVIVGEAADGQEGIEAVDRLGPDLVLMDIRMPRVDGLTATRRLLARPAPPKILILTTIDADASVLEALRLGAHGFLLKDTPPDRIVDGITRVAAGEPILSPAVTAQLIAAVAAPVGSDRTATARSRLADLTEREHEVALAVARGRSNADIAADLYLSLATVKAHVTRIFTKLGVDNRVQVAICVHEAGLV